MDRQRLIAIVLLVGCSGPIPLASEEPAPEQDAGTAGMGGTGGLVGPGGSAGEPGTAGAGGMAGEAGTAGAGGAGGMAGSAGVGGFGGFGGIGGIGGTAGVGGFGGFSGAGGMAGEPGSAGMGGEPGSAGQGGESGAGGIPSGRDWDHPQLIDLDIYPREMDVTGGPAEVTCSLSATDSPGGVDRTICWFYPPTNDNTSFACIADEPSSGDMFSGVWSCAVTIDQWAWDGVWILGQIHMVDSRGNKINYNARELGEMGHDIEFTVY